MGNNRTTVIPIGIMPKTHYKNGSHFILSGLNYYVLASKNKYNVLTLQKNGSSYLVFLSCI